MKIFSHHGVANVDVMSWTSHLAGPIASGARPAIATHAAAMPATKRRAAAATVASVNRGTT